MRMILVLMLTLLIEGGWTHLTYLAIRLPLQGTRAPPGSPWPLPRQHNSTSHVLAARKDLFSFEVNLSCDILDSAVKRYRKLIFPKEGKALDSLDTISKLEIKVNGECEKYPYMGMDESYTLTVNTISVLSSQSVWGALRGLETFSQLFYKDEEGLLNINVTSIRDEPRFPHRGIMLDTARHFIPVTTLLLNLDAMAFNKMNVFHWHIVDDQSFPFESKVFPELSKYGAYSDGMIYTPSDVKRVIEYARLRGIRVIPEFDTPGHTQSWGQYFKELLTPCYVDGVPGRMVYNKHGAYELMDPTKNFTFEFLDKLFSEVVEVFPDSYVHLGMDESYHACWESNPNVREFMSNQLGLNQTDFEGLEKYYDNRVISIVQSKSAEIITWQDPVDQGIQLNKDSLVEVWKGRQDWSKYVENVVGRGYDVILSSCWYLNYISYGADWKQYYQCDPHNFNGTESQKEQIKGGEACVWAEYVDVTNILPRLWPRASAVAERLWSSSDVTNVDDASFRLDQHRCRMRRRGIPAEPIFDGYCEELDTAPSDPYDVFKVTHPTDSQPHVSSRNTANRILFQTCHFTFYLLFALFLPIYFCPDFAMDLSM